jgi:hypothetical protein
MRISQFLLTNGYPNKNKNNNRVKSKRLELFELAGKKLEIICYLINF